MAQNKKDFRAAAASAFVDAMITPEPKPTPRAKHITAASSTPQTNKAGDEIKVTFMVDAETESKLRYIAFKERSKQKAIVNAALHNYIADYERKNGKI